MCGHAAVDGAAVAEVYVGGVRQVVEAAIRLDASDLHETIGVRDARRRADHRGVHDAEDRRVGGDAKRDDGHRERGMRRRAAQSPPARGDVVCQRRDPPFRGELAEGGRNGARRKPDWPRGSARVSADQRPQFAVPHLPPLPPPAERNKPARGAQNRARDDQPKGRAAARVHRVTRSARATPRP